MAVSGFGYGSVRWCRKMDLWDFLIKSRLLDLYDEDMFTNLMSFFNEKDNNVEIFLLMLTLGFYGESGHESQNSVR